MSVNNIKTSGVITLNTIVANILNDTGIYSKENHRRYLQWAIRAVTDLNLFVMDNYEVAYLDIDPDLRTAQLPSDYIDYTKIGVCYNGRVWTLGLNKTMCNPRDIECLLPIRDVIYSQNDSGVIYDAVTMPFVEHSYNGTIVSNLFGIGGGYNFAYYKIDKEQGTILLDGAVPIDDKLVLEYKTSGVSLQGTTYIPKQAQESIIAYVHWFRVMNDQTANLGQQQLREKQRDDAIRRLSAFEGAFTIDEMKDVLFASYKQSPKR